MKTNSLFLIYSFSSMNFFELFSVHLVLYDIELRDAFRCSELSCKKCCAGCCDGSGRCFDIAHGTHGLKIAILADSLAFAPVNKHGPGDDLALAPWILVNSLIVAAVITECLVPHFRICVPAPKTSIELHHVLFLGSILICTASAAAST